MTNFILRIAVATAISIFSGAFNSALAVEPENSATIESSTELQFVFISELGAMLKSTDGKLTVTQIEPEEQRSKEYKDVDLQNGDAVIMINGTRIKSSDDFNELYMQLESGEIVKLGISRDGDLMIVSFEKGEAGEQPEKQMVMMSIDPSAPPDSNVQRTVIRMNPSDAPVAILMEAGVMLKETDDGLVADQVFPTYPDTYTGDKIEVGDRFISIDGKKVSNTDDLRDVFDNANSGAKLDIVLKRGSDLLGGTISKSNDNLQINKETL